MSLFVCVLMSFPHGAMGWSVIVTFPVISITHFISCHLDHLFFMKVHFLLCSNITKISALIQKCIFSNFGSSVGISSVSFFPT